MNAATLIAIFLFESVTTSINMVVVAVAGGTGDMGRLITDALVETGKHEVYVISRKVHTLRYISVFRIG